MELLKRQELLESSLLVEENCKQSVEKSSDNYVFFVSTLWNESDTTNQYRSNYILSCAKNKDIDFHGGFFVNPKLCTEIPREVPPNLLYNKYIANKVYQKEILKSAFVFNTPAVHNCHGWKLAEYLYMGKAVISTPLTNELPIPLQHLQELYIVENNQELEEAIVTLLKDKELTMKLRKKARAYYDHYVSPVQVINLLLTGHYRGE